MIRKVVKIVVWTSGITVMVVFLLFVALVVDRGKSSARTEQDHIIQRRPSPDGKLVAEIHTFTTAMWGGPDTLYVSIGEVEHAHGDKVYSRTYECDDFSGFKLEWNTPKDLTVTYGECNPPSGDQSPAEHARENKIWQSNIAWRDVMIHYIDSHHSTNQ